MRDSGPFQCLGEKPFVQEHLGRLAIGHARNVRFTIPCREVTHGLAPRISAGDEDSGLHTELIRAGRQGDVAGGWSPGLRAFYRATRRERLAKSPGALTRMGCRPDLLRLRSTPSAVMPSPSTTGEGWGGRPRLHHAWGDCSAGIGGSVRASMTTRGSYF